MGRIKDLTINSMHKKLTEIVTEFTKGILGNGSNRSKCFMVCSPLSSYLSFLGYENDIVEGEIEEGDAVYEHYWLKYDDVIIDPTASQFKTPDGSVMPDVYIGKKPNWYKVIDN